MFLAEELLHPEARELIRASLGGKTRAEMDVAETRAAMLAGRAWQEPPPAVPSFDTAIAGVRVRWYGPDTGPCAVFAHGGRFFSGDLETHDAPLRLLQNLSGWRLCAVDYRLAPEHLYPSAVDDVLAVAQALKPNVVMGDSAGGYLAARASRHAERAMLIYPMLDPLCASDSYRRFWDGPWPNGSDMRRGWELWGVSERTVNGLAVPAIVVTAGIDPLLDEAVDLCRELGAVRWHYADMHHGFFTQTRLARSRELIERIAVWLQEADGAPSASPPGR